MDREYVSNLALYIFGTPQRFNAHFITSTQFLDRLFQVRPKRPTNTVLSTIYHICFAKESRLIDEYNKTFDNQETKGRNNHAAAHTTATDHVTRIFRHNQIMDSRTRNSMSCN
jgi:hypothetical protein